MRATILCLALGAAAGCETVPDRPIDRPAALHPVDQFPAPPGFAAEQTGPGQWTFTGYGKPRQAALFYRVSCIELFDWTLDSEDEAADGSWRLAFARDGAELLVHVRGGDDGDSLECLVTLQR